MATQAPHGAGQDPAYRPTHRHLPSDLRRSPKPVTDQPRNHGPVTWGFAPVTDHDGPRPAVTRSAARRSSSTPDPVLRRPAQRPPRRVELVGQRDESPDSLPQPG